MKRMRVAVLVSGTGRSLENLLHLEREGKLPTRIVLVVSSRAGVRALDIAETFGVPSRVLPPEEVTAALDEVEPDLVVMAGYTRLWPIPERYVGRTINIHPALLPRHGGRGFYGKRVHEAVLKAGDRVSGCTVHWVDDRYDTGPPIARREVPVLPGDTPETLADRVFAEELEVLPEVIRGIAEGRITMDS